MRSPAETAAPGRSAVRSSREEQGKHVSPWRRGATDFDGLSGEERSKLHFLLLSQFMLGLGDSIATPDRSDSFAQFIDGAASSSLNLFPQWWKTFRGAPEFFAPNYTRHVGDLARQADAPDVLEFMPWFAVDESEKGGA